MATIWFKQTEDCRYEVRTAGNSIRLYTNGVFHSQWNPKRPIAGHLWDLLFIPACFHSQVSDIQSALVLGVGGGAVINLLQSFCALQTINAVDLDAEHFYIAEQYFGIHHGTAKVNCFCREAKTYMSTNKQRYQFVLEDLFINEAGTSNAVRAIEADRKWMEKLAASLTSDGILVMNFESIRQLRLSLPPKLLTELGFVSIAELALPRYENAIAVLSKTKLDRKIFLENIRELELQARFSFAKNDYALRLRQLAT